MKNQAHGCRHRSLDRAIPDVHRDVNVAAPGRRFASVRILQQLHERIEARWPEGSLGRGNRTQAA